MKKPKSERATVQQRSSATGVDQPSTAAAPPAKTPATVAQLRAACTGADGDFLLSQLEIGATVQEALSAWIAEQTTRIVKLQQELAQQRSAGR